MNDRNVSAIDHPGSPAESPAEAEHADSGLTFSVAKTFEQVVSAWNLVHDTYVRAGLLEPRPNGIHSSRQAASANAAVIVGAIQGLTVATMTAILDSPAGLPLDSAYRTELDQLRASGCKLMEFGLFADRRTQISRSFSAVLQLMRYTMYFGYHAGATDGVIGVHPRHAKFYARYLNFDIIGDAKSYATVCGAPVVLLRHAWAEKLRSEHKPQGIQFLLDNPVPPQEYAQRYMFDNAALARLFPATPGTVAA